MTGEIFGYRRRNVSPAIAFLNSSTLPGDMFANSYREDQRAVPVRRQGHTAEYSEGVALAIERGWLVMHESGTFVKFGQAGADLFA